MEKVTLGGVERVEKQEEQTIKALIEEHSKDVHYLAFSNNLTAYTPLGSWLQSNAELKDKSNEIIKAAVSNY